MNPVLIYTDSSQIEEAKAQLTQSIGHFQDLYDAFRAIGIDVTVLEMADETTIMGRDQQSQHLENLVLDKLMAKAGTPDFGGVPISQEKLRTLLDKPDVTAIKTLIKNNYIRVRGGYEPSLFEVIDGQVSLISTAFDTIESRFTYYTKNKNGEVAAKHLMALAEGVNKWLEYLQAPRLESYNPIVEQFKTIGLKLIRGGIFAPDVEFIRNQESRFSNQPAQ